MNLAECSVVMCLRTLAAQALPKTTVLKHRNSQPLTMEPKIGGLEDDFPFQLGTF